MRCYGSRNGDPAGHDGHHIRILQHENRIIQKFLTAMTNTSALTIAVVGAGNVGGALAASWSRAGHTIRLGVRDTVKFKGQELLAYPGITAHSIAEAVGPADVVLVAVPPEHALSLAEVMGDLNGKVLIDATNAVRSRPEGYPTAFHAFRALTHADVVKAFNSTGFENMRQPDYGPFRLDMFMAGDSVQGKAVVFRLAMDAGFGACHDFGGDDRVVLLEQLALAWINLAIFQGMGRDIGFRLVRRGSS